MPFGWLLALAVTEEPWLASGGLFTVCILAGAEGRLFATEEDDVGRGGGARFPKVADLVPTPCLFNASIRAFRVLNCGSSTSAIVDIKVWLLPIYLRPKSLHSRRSEFGFNECGAESQTGSTMFNRMRSEGRYRMFCLTTVRPCNKILTKNKRSKQISREPRRVSASVIRGFGVELLDVGAQGQSSRIRNFVT